MLVTADSFDLHQDEVPIPEGTQLGDLSYSEEQRISKAYPGIKPGESVGQFYDRTESENDASFTEKENAHAEESEAADREARRQRFTRLNYPEYGVIWKTQFAGARGWENHIPVGSGVVDKPLWRSVARSMGEPDQDDFIVNGFSPRWFRNTMVRYKDLGGQIRGTQAR